MADAARLRKMISKSQARLKMALKEGKGSGLFRSEDDGLSDVLCSVKEDLDRLPGMITLIVEQGVKSGAREEVVRNVRTILQSEMLETGRDFGRLIDRRSQSLKSIEDKKSRLDLAVDRGETSARSRAMFKKNVEEEVKGRGMDEEDSKMLEQRMSDEQEAKDRAKKARKINDTLTDIMSAFQKMTTIVSMQESRLESIDRDTRQAEKDVKQGRREVEQIYDDVGSKRRLILKVFAVIIVFSVIYIMFLL